MNCNQRNFNKNEYSFSNKKRRPEQECWFCRPCYNNFPPEINWDCEDTFHSKKNFYSENIESDYDDFDLEYSYDLDNEYHEYDKYNNRKENKNFNDKDPKKNCSQKYRPCNHCQKRHSCCGFFRIFHC